VSIIRYKVIENDDLWFGHYCRKRIYMSQSDYIQYRKTSHVLKEAGKLQPVLSSQQYTSFKSYSLENTIQSYRSVYYKMLDDSLVVVYDIPLNNVASCPNINYCQNTNTRPNRVLNMVFGTKYTPKPSRPLDMKYIKTNHPEKVSILSHPNCRCMDE